jgi:FkbM family methyltransferase
MRQRIAAAADLARRNPSLFGQRVAAHVKGKLRPLRGRRTALVGGRVQVEFDPALDPIVRQMWAGSYAPAVVSAIRRILQPGEVAIDVGANIGYLSAVMLAVVGERGAVHAFEPVTRYAERLDLLAKMNPGLELVVQKMALSDRAGEATMAVGRGNLGWNTMVPGLMPADDQDHTERVTTRRLDSYLAERNLEPSLVKIDVEGFEPIVLDGLSRFLDSGHRPTIICEVAPQAYERLGRHGDDLVDWMERFGYRCVDPIDLATPIPLANFASTTDVVFLHP